MLRPDAIADNRATNLNLYPKKRELEKQVRTGLGQDFYCDRHFSLMYDDSSSLEGCLAQMKHSCSPGVESRLRRDFSL